MKLLAVAWIVFVAAVYVPDVGRGFVKDDVTWTIACTPVPSPESPVPGPRPGFRLHT